jgi:hypothetical protein
MNDLDCYLYQFFLNSEQLATTCGLSPERLSQLVADELIPAPSYIVSESSVISSFVFGRMEAKGAIDGQYFHPTTSVWVNKAIYAISEFGQAGAQIELKRQFTKNLKMALSELDKSIWRLRDSFTDDGAVIEEGLQARIDSIWEHFLKGTFGLCVAKPDSERAIARKEILQEKLTELTENGKREHFSKTEVPYFLALIDDFAKATMPFSPIEYSKSSRKRLVENLRARIAKV